MRILKEKKVGCPGNHPVRSEYEEETEFLFLLERHNRVCGATVTLCSFEGGAGRQLYGVLEGQKMG